MFDPSRVIFIDFEASSLYRNSWPIEVGLAWTDGHTANSWSSLICPRPEWSMEGWAPESEEIHNIKMDWLYSAPSARDVAEEMMTRIGNRYVISDAREFDQHWFDRLVAAMEDPPNTLLRMEEQLFGFDEIDPREYFQFQTDHEHEHTHRAADDALLMAKSLLHSLRK